jgi:hypothetical protein
MRFETMNTIVTRLTAVALVVVSSSIVAPAGQAQPTAGVSASPAVFVNGIRPQDEIVVVNTRYLCGTCDANAMRAALHVETYAVADAGGRRHWQASDLDRFLAFDPTVRTIVFVHGNQITPGDAKREGLSVYCRLMRYGAGSERIRFVIFSWPSSKVGGLLRDVREKAARTGPAGCELAWLVDQMPAETPLSLLGFSYGARIITGSLHILGGGSLGGMRLNERAHPGRPPVNVVLLAAAMHSYWLGEGQYHGRAMSQVDELFLVNSCNDPAMRYYHIMVPGRGGPQAMGLRGPTNLSADQWAKVQQCDIGANHDLYAYLSSMSVNAQIWDNLSDAAAAAPPAN